MWKNGQCVTVKGKRYRVKSSYPKHSCFHCALLLLGHADGCKRVCSPLFPKLGMYQYLEEIPAKGKVLAK